MGVLTSLLELNFPWPISTVASWPFREGGIQQQLPSRSQLTLHKPCPGSGPRFSLCDYQGAGSRGGTSDQREQWPKDPVTEGWGRRACPSSLQKLLPFAHLPALAQTVTQAQTTPPGARISATINCRLLFAQPSLRSHLPHLPSLPRTEMFAQLKIPESYRCGGLNHFRALSNLKPGRDSFTFHNTLRRPSEDQGRMCGV